MNYYNDNDTKACAWLRELIAAKLIPQGEIDSRSITDVQPGDLRGFNQIHFFAGIGGWARALQLAGWPEDQHVWTASCPCQPFSCAGKQKGIEDKRHLWPEVFRLIRECRPDRVFGEQVQAAIGLGWLDGIFADLEAESYACGSVVLGAHSVGAPHIRQRIYWVADSQSNEHDGNIRNGDATGRSGFANCGRLGDAEHNRREGRKQDRQGTEAALPSKHFIRMGIAARDGRDERWTEPGRPERITEASGVGESETDRREVRTQLHGELHREGSVQGCEPNFWSDAIWHPCRDGKVRRISPEPSLFPLADGLPGRVGILRGAGNAIVPEVAAQFIKAYLACHH